MNEILINAKAQFSIITIYFAYRKSTNPITYNCQFYHGAIDRLYFINLSFISTKMKSTSIWVLISNYLVFVCLLMCVAMMAK